jgi:hypothetical protein
MKIKTPQMRRFYFVVSESIIKYCVVVSCFRYDVRNLLAVDTPNLRGEMKGGNPMT